MRFIAELQLEHPKLLLTPTIQRCPEMSITLEYQLIASGGEYVLLFHVRGKAFEHFEAALDDDPTVMDVSTIIETTSFRVYRTRLAFPEYLVLAEAVEMGMRLLEAVSADGGWYAVLELPNVETLHSFRAVCSDYDVSTSIRKLYRIEADQAGEAYGLTPSQCEAITTAFEAGYFNQPRDCSLEGVADKLGISSSAAGGRLRRGLRTLINETLYTQPQTTVPKHYLNTYKTTDTAGTR